MNKLLKFMQKFAMDYVLKHLRVNKDQVIIALNKKIDMPILNEAQEKELIDAVYEVVLDVVEGMKK